MKKYIPSFAGDWRDPENPYTEDFTQEDEEDRYDEEVDRWIDNYLESKYEY